MSRLATCMGLLVLVATAGEAATAAPGGPPAPRKQASSDVVSAVQLAAAFGTVTSVFRSVAHNQAVGGVRNSYHLNGQAIDVARRPGVSHQAVEAALIGAGYQIIESLDEGDHSHFAFAPGRIAPRPTKNVSPIPLPPALAADEHGSLVVTAEPLIRDEPRPSSETPER